MSDRQEMPQGARPPQPGLLRALFYAAYVATFVLLLLGPLYFGASLYKRFEAVLDWGPNGGAQAIGIVAAASLSRCAPLRWGWRGALPGFLAAVTIDLLMFVNAIGVAVVLWAVSPDAASGSGGQYTVLIAAFILTLPAIRGAFRLLERWQKADVPWRNFFADSNFRPREWYGIILTFPVLVVWLIAAATLERWLVSAYPAAEATPSHGFLDGFLLVAGILVATSPRDLRSFLKSLLALLVVFNTVVASEITIAVMVEAFQSDSPWLSTAHISLVAPGFLGAVLLLAHRPGGWSDEKAGVEAGKRIAL